MIFFMLDILARPSLSVPYPEEETRKFSPGGGGGGFSVFFEPERLGITTLRLRLEEECVGLEKYYCGGCSLGGSFLIILGLSRRSFIIFQITSACI